MAFFCLGSAIAWTCLELQTNTIPWEKKYSAVIFSPPSPPSLSFCARSVQANALAAELAVLLAVDRSERSESNAERSASNAERFAAAGQAESESVGVEERGGEAADSHQPKQAKDSSAEAAEPPPPPPPAAAPAAAAAGATTAAGDGEGENKADAGQDVADEPLASA